MHSRIIYVVFIMLGIDLTLSDQPKGVISLPNNILSSNAPTLLHSIALTLEQEHIQD